MDTFDIKMSSKRSVMENLDHNTLVAGHERYEFHNNFVNTPWDDRSRRSKFGIVCLLVAIFGATMAVVVYNLLLHYKSHGGSVHKLEEHVAAKCQLVTVEDYRYVARLHSVGTQDFVCVGAVITYTTVLAHNACVKNGQIHIHVGSPTDPHCNIGFDVSGVEQIGPPYSEFVLLTTSNSMSNCALTIKIGSNLQKAMLGFVIGRPSRNEKLLSRHAVIVEGKYCSCSVPVMRKSMNSSIGLLCVNSLIQCPMLVGDLLVQSNVLYGLAATSTYNNKACYADLSIIIKDLKLNL